MTIDSTAIDEQELIRRLKTGEPRAFSLLVRRYHETLFRIACAITMDPEESLDVMQDVFLSVHRHIGGFRGESGLSAWLRKITVNICLNWKRKWKRRFRWRHRPFETRDGRNPVTPETAYREKEFEHRMMAEIKALPEKLRVVFVLNTLEGMSYDRIAGCLGVKRGTVSSRLYNARRILKSRLNGS